MKRFLVLVLGSFILCLANGRTVDKSEALSIAKDFFSKPSTSLKSTSATPNYSLAFTATSEKTLQDNAEAQPYFYVYNIGDEEGFIIISADTRTKSVIGYANTGHFENDNIPNNVKEWLELYTNEIKYAIENLPEVEEMTSLKSTTTEAFIRTVEPLLGTIAYNQKTPYNNNCPIYNGDTCVTGCVATAMAQIMRYYQWPVTGVGSNTYTSYSYGFNLTADFSTSTYDWGNMPTTFSGNETGAQDSAIALLMSDVGISVNMNYGLYGSSASISKAVSGLYSYFGYDAGIQIYSRKYWSASEWEEMIKNELNNNRPILYSGVASSGEGHAFVCDGYDSDNLFHINWGWGGSSNGYFQLSLLNAHYPGIEPSPGGFNLSQQIVGGIQKAKEGSITSQKIGVDSISTYATSVTKDETVDIIAYKLYNTGGFSATNTVVKLAIRNSEDSLIAYLDSFIYGVNSWSEEIYFSDIHFSTYDIGSYCLSLQYLNSDGDYDPVMVARNGSGSINLAITDTQLIFNKINNRAKLALTAKPATHKDLYYERSGAFDITIRNSGNSDYFAQIGISLVDTSNINDYYSMVNSLVEIRKGESKTFILSDIVPCDSGTYYVQVYYDENNDEDDTGFPYYQLGPQVFVDTVTVNPEPSEASFVIIGNPAMPTPIEPNQMFTLTVQVKNEGGYYDNDIKVYVYDTNGYYKETFGYQSLILGQDSTITIDFDGQLSLDEGQYYTRLSYYVDGWKRLGGPYYFEIKEGIITNLEDANDISEFEILNNPVESTLKVSLPEEARLLKLYNMKGQEIDAYTVGRLRHTEISIDHLKSGIYVLMLETDTTSKTLKFIKK